RKYPTMSNGLTGKQRAARIPLDYFEKPDWIVKRKRALTYIFTGLTGLWIVTLLFGGSGPLGKKRYSHGPVATAHASFEHECSACHVNFAFFKPNLDDKESQTLGCSAFAGDKKCMECHLYDGQAVHHSTQKAKDWTPSCG